MTSTNWNKRLEALEAAAEAKAGAGGVVTEEIRQFIRSLSSPDLRLLIKLIEKWRGGGGLDAEEQDEWDRLNQLFEGMGHHEHDQKTA